MARKKKQQAAENTEGWLTTYADLVSLLMCFFVLMYSASTPDEARMQWILKSFTSLTGTIVNPVVLDDPMENSTGGEEDFDGPHDPPPGPGDVIGVDGVMPMTFDDMYNWVSNAIDLAELNDSVSVDATEGRLHIRFDSDIMFAADSYALLPAGIDALRKISPSIRIFNPYISSVVVQGHTAPLPNGEKRHVTDTFLSAMRAVTVQDYLDFQLRMADSNKFEATGLGPWHPYYFPLDDPIVNAKNRRVELVITRNDYNPKGTSVMLDTLEHDYGLGPVSGGEAGNRIPTPAELDKSRQVAELIRGKYGDIDKSSSSDPTNEFGPSIPKLPQVAATEAAAGE